MIKQLLNSAIAKYRDLSVARRSIICPEEVGQAISELSRELSTNQIAPFSHRVLK